MANNKTRWNSTLMMLERALQCQAHLQAYCSNWRPEKLSKSNGDDSGYDLREDILSPEDWKGVREVVNVLKPLLYYTKLAEQWDTGLQDWVPIVDKIVVHFSGASQRFKERADEGPVYEWLHICCEKALSKLDRYFKLAHKSPVYYTAMVMDPSLKYAWFEQRWTTPSKSERIPDVKTAVRTLWGRAQDRSRKAAQSDSVNLPAPQQEVHDDSDDNSDSDDHDDSDDHEFQYDHKSIVYTTINNSDSAFEKYCAEDALEGFELSDWGKLEKTQPNLVQFALDHPLPISVSECERSFSSAKFTLNPLRACMKSDLFEALETLRAWFLKDGVEDDKEKRRREELEVISEMLQSLV